MGIAQLFLHFSICSPESVLIEGTLPDLLVGGQRFRSFYKRMLSQEAENLFSKSFKISAISVTSTSKPILPIHLEKNLGDSNYTRLVICT